MCVLDEFLEQCHRLAGSIGRTGLRFNAEFSCDRVPLRDALLRVRPPIQELLDEPPVLRRRWRGPKHCDRRDQLAGLSPTEGKTERALAVALTPYGFKKVLVRL